MRRTHLQRPADDEIIAMCGLADPRLSSMIADRPRDVDCLRCLNFYHHNMDWFWHLLGFEVPIGERYSRTDTPIPELHLVGWPVRLGFKNDFTHRIDATVFALQSFKKEL